MSKLFLIDGHALVFRMYYAFLRRPMVNSKGMDTSILFGFTKYLLELIRREHPTHLGVMFDPPAKTFRHELDPEYKATRGATPELVKEALDPLVNIVQALKIPVLMKPGFEADDVIGTVAKKFACEDMNVYIVSPDKDLGQVVDTHIYQYKPGKSGNDNEILSKEQICEKYGIGDPGQIIDILAIWGDASDNVKGIEGVGEVGARKLISKYGTMENIVEHAGELTPKLRDNVLAAVPHLQLSKTLVTIRTDVDIDCDIDELKISAPDSKEVSKLFNLYEFPSLIALLPEGTAVEAPVREELKIKEASCEELADIAKSERKVALRTSGGIILSASGRYARFSPAQAKPVLEDCSIAKMGHSIKEDYMELKRQGITLAGELLDAELMHYLLDPERNHGLEFLTSSYLNAELVERNDGEGALLFDFDDRSAARECVAIAAIVPLLERELKKEGMDELYRNVEMPLIEVLAAMEMTGVKVDTDALNKYRESLSAELNAIEREARAAVDEPSLNLSSPKQVGIVLYEKLALNPKVKKNSRESYPTDEETLHEMEDKHPFIGMLLEYRALKKLISGYVDPLPSLVNPSTGRIHTTFNQALTATGRLSSARPNLQNIPIRSERGMKIREAFVPGNPEGFIISADYSQIELRIMAHLSGDPHLIEGFRQGADVHRATAARIFHKEPQDVTDEERRRAKVANFGIIYGISAFGLAQRMEISRSESKLFIEEYFRSYPDVRNYIDRSIAKARDNGYVTTLFGRKRFLPDITSKNPTVRGFSERNAVNAPVQGSAADIIKLAMISVHKAMKAEGMRSRMVLQVHDELVFDVVPEERERLMEIVEREMENVVELSVPLTAECNYGKNWKEAH